MSVPRRNRLDQMTPAELAIFEAARAVEQAGGGPRLTTAVVLLAQAQSQVADFVDGVPPGVAADRPTAISEITTERLRQIVIEGFKAAHDDAHTDGQLAMAAQAYALAAGVKIRDHMDYGYPPAGWPWSRDWWKPTTPRRDLIKAGALIVAEIDRLDRAEAAASQELPQ